MIVRSGSDAVVEAVSLVRAGAEDAFATFEVEARPELWVQYLQGMINAAYPFSDDPARRITLPDFTLMEWEANGYVAGYLAYEHPDVIADWIDRYFREVLASGDHTLRVALNL